jgi:hypothetical protein
MLEMMNSEEAEQSNREDSILEEDILKDLRRQCVRRNTRACFNFEDEMV